MTKRRRGEKDSDLVRKADAQLSEADFSVARGAGRAAELSRKTARNPNFAAFQRYTDPAVLSIPTFRGLLIMASAGGASCPNFLPIKHAAGTRGNLRMRLVNATVSGVPGTPVSLSSAWR